MSRSRAAFLALLALLGAMPAPAAAAPDGDALVELGRRLFFDPVLGRQGRIGCASCHDPERGFSDARAVSLDEAGLSSRHSQPLVDLAGEGFHWDGEFATVRDVIDARVQPGGLPASTVANRSLERLRRALAEDGPLPSAQAVEKLIARLPATVRPYYGGLPANPVAFGIDARIGRDGLYAKGFDAAFGDATVTPDRIGDALEAYLATLRSATNAFDRHVAGDATALTPAAKRGHELFAGKAGCVACHVAEGSRPAFTDGRFHNTGVEVSRVRKAAWRKQTVDRDAGRLAWSFRFAERSAFKTPGLRDVARRAPYFHDGSAATLADVVRYYDEGGPPDEDLDGRLHPLNLSRDEAADLVAFLESLTGETRPGLGAPNALRSPRLAIRVECLDGSAVAGATLTVRPFGDRLATVAAMPAAFRVTTDAEGNASVAMPASTHVVVEAAGVETSAPLPDWTTSVRLLFVPQETIALAVRFPTEGPVPPSLFAFEPSADRFSDRADDRPMFSFVRMLGPGEALFVECSPPVAPAEAPGLVQRAGILSAESVQSADLCAGRLHRVDLRSTRDVPDTGSDGETAQAVRQMRELMAGRSVTGSLRFARDTRAVKGR